MTRTPETTLTVVHVAAPALLLPLLSLRRSTGLDIDPYDHAVANPATAERLRAEWAPR